MKKHSKYENTAKCPRCDHFHTGHDGTCINGLLSHREGSKWVKNDDCKCVYTAHERLVENLIDAAMSAVGHGMSADEYPIALVRARGKVLVALEKLDHHVEGGMVDWPK